MFDFHKIVYTCDIFASSSEYYEFFFLATNRYLVGDTVTLLANNVRRVLLMETFVSEELSRVYKLAALLRL